MARKLTWEVPANTWPYDVTASQATLLIPGNGVSTLSSDTAQLISWEDVEGSEDESVWVERIVGHSLAYLIDVADGPPDPRFMHERIHIGMTTSLEGVQVSNYQADLSDVDGAEERFLWHRHRAVFSATDNGGAPTPENSGDLVFEEASTAHPYWTRIDVRVGRMLRPPFTLGLTVNSTMATTTSLVYLAWLRLLVSR